MRRLPSLVFAILVFSFPALAQEWNDVRSPNFHMLTNGSTKVAKDALWKLEQARVVFGHLMNRAKVSRNRPMLIFGLQSASEVRALVGNAQMIPGGFALSTEDRNYIVADLSAANWSGIHRALALLMLNANYPRTQPWVDEGIAEYIAGLTIDPKQISAGVTPEIRQTLDGGAAMPVEKLIAPDVQGSPQFRATAWLLVRWLIDNQQMENIGPYLSQVMNRGVAPAAAFRQAFSMTPAEMDAVLEKHKPTAFLPKAAEKPAELDTQQFTVVKVAEEEARAVQAQLRLELPEQREQALATLRQMLAQNPENVEVHRGLGIALLRLGDKNAADFIRRAIEIRDDSALMHYLIAVWRNRGSREAIQVDSEGPTVALQSEKALDLDPEFASAYQLLAESQLASQHPEKALATIRKGMAIAPRNESLMLTFASIQIANSKYDEVRGLLKFLQASSDPAVSKRAGDMLTAATRLLKSEQKLVEQAQRYTDPTSPKWKPKEDTTGAAPASAEGEKAAEEAKPDTRKIEYVKGTLLSVQCPDERRATLSVSANKKTWKFDVTDRSKALLIGADKFECEWKNVPVSVNYRASGAQQGDVVSLEVD